MQAFWVSNIRGVQFKTYRLFLKQTWLNSKLALLFGLSPVALKLTSSWEEMVELFKWPIKEPYTYIGSVIYKVLLLLSPLGTILLALLHLEPI